MQPGLAKLIYTKVVGYLCAPNKPSVRGAVERKMRFPSFMAYMSKPKWLIACPICTILKFFYVNHLTLIYFLVRIFNYFPGHDLHPDTAGDQSPVSGSESLQQAVCPLSFLSLVSKGCLNTYRATGFGQASPCPISLPLV